LVAEQCESDSGWRVWGPQAGAARRQDGAIE
jgi:hypothetical protein